MLETIQAARFSFTALNLSPLAVIAPCPRLSMRATRRTEHHIGSRDIIIHPHADRGYDESTLESENRKRADS